MAGKIYSKNTMMLRFEHGTANDDEAGTKYELAASNSGAPLIRSGKTGKFYNEALQLVTVLTDHRGRLQENEAKFVSDLHDKLEQYGERTFLSEKQMHWLRALAKTHVPDPRQMSFL